MHLERMILAYMNEEIELGVIEDYCYNMEINEQNKRELAYCIQSFDLDVLYTNMLKKFGGIISDDEKNYYITRYNRLFVPEWGKE